ncbi:T9SS type A sorting domain-containing protein [uncultured Psychroserpens sp.]|uniref:T9SS type A sorting domain-containing protein n=1 Tax=uncultured Psychroserpens sp. TaxID=255436 RepID=UPI00262DCF08|nr:T9SS type A sorting domain-containing protein [uncultured Psychroserpens sp.]
MYSQNIYQGDVLLTTQSEIDDFGVSSYTDINGSLRIASYLPDSDITDLTALNTISSISNNLEIFGNPYLESLDGFNNLVSIGNFLDIRSSGLKDLKELENLVFIGNSIYVLGANGLESLEGLEGITSLPGSLVIQSSEIKTLHGLENLVSLNFLYLFNNGAGNSSTSITSLSGLENLDSIDDIRIKNNLYLSDFCALFGYFNNNIHSGLYDVAFNGYDPTMDDISNGNCTNLSPNLDITYPLENSYFVVGNVDLKTLDGVGIPHNYPIDISFSSDGGNTWVEDGSYQYNAINKGIIWTTPIVTAPTEFIVRLEAIINGNTIIEYSNIFTIQPINYYDSMGFVDEGISSIDFPMQGTSSETDGWFTLNLSTAHNCLDGNAQDWYNWKLNLACGKDLRAPFNGKVIKIVSEHESNSCGFNPEGGSYAKQIIIQSNEDKTFAIRFAHLQNIRPDIYEDSIVSKNQLIGKIGGSGIENVHLHSTLYKNIYDYLFVDYTEGGGIITHTVKELLETGRSLTNLETPNCELLKENFSAPYSFNNYFNVSNTIITILTGTQFLSLVSNQFNSFNLDVVIGSFFEGRQYSNDPITTLDGLETVLSIDGNLVIYDTEITNLNGIENLTYVGGDVIIQDNNSLIDFCGLFALLENDGIQGELIINGNAINPISDDILNNIDCVPTLSDIEINEQVDISIYPNPTDGSINISSSMYLEILSIEIFSLEGKKVKEIKPQNIINIEDLSNGLYFLKLKTENFILVEKILKYR